MKFIFIGDVMGRPGRKALSKLLDHARQDFNPDFMILNGENAAGGFGLTEKIYNQMIDSFGFDAVTMGNHWQDKSEIHKLL
jgi:calcineurin-like phosphoesterase